jgi:hypothetical protein
MARNTHKKKTVENKKCTCRTWNIVRNLKIMENEKHTTVPHEIWQETLKNVENVKFTW